MSIYFACHRVSLLCGARTFARFCIHELLEFVVLIMLGVFCPKLGVMIGKGDINVCVLINQRFTCGTLNEW